MLFDSSSLIVAAAPYVFIALALIASFILFASLKRDLQEQSYKQRHAIDQILTRLRDAEQTETISQAVIYLPAVRSSFNIHRRAQALRLLRRGENVAHIAAALNVPRKEVELLIRVQKMPARRDRRPGSPAFE
ncbi:MAG: hypothetical protein ABL995_01850 [Bryobacteraceae bacterium]